MEICLTDEYKIKKSGVGFNLCYTSKELVEKTNQKTKETRLAPIEWEKYYGTLYQTLQSFVHIYSSECDNLDDVILKADEAIRVIEEKCADVKKKYCIINMSKP